MPDPAEQGYSAPGEWQRHTRCWMAWPCRESRWGDHLDGAQDAYAQVAAAVSEFEPVTMITRPEHVAEVSLRAGASAATLPLMHDDSRLRDTGPTFLTGDAGLAGVSWAFNGWGGRSDEIDHDGGLAQDILNHLKAPCFEAQIVAEGAAFQVDGAGTLIATEQCLLNPNRNPGLSRETAEEHLRRTLGVETIIWLAGGLSEDPLDGHVENLACFVKPGVVLVPGARDQSDPNQAVLQENLARLQGARDNRGEALEVIVLEQPKARDDGHGGRLCLSYVNLYVANGGVVMPAFEDSMDDRAAEVVEGAFSDRSICQVPALELAYGGVGIHSITLGQPEVGQPESGQAEGVSD